MININLLPEVLRKKERMPLPQFMALLVMIGLIGGAFYMITKYQFNVIPTLNRQESSLNQNKRELTAQTEELKKINAEIDKLSNYVNTVKGLYKNRIVWAKILSDIKNIVNFDPSLSEYNGEMRYLWITKLSGSGKQIRLNGFATAANEVVAMRMPERLLSTILTYAPVTLPEKDEEARLQAELREAIAEHDTLRRENPDLPIQGAKEISIRQRMDEIKNMKSGGIAMQPFNTLLAPGSLKLNSATWTNAPKPQRRAALTEIFPEKAWAFDISMTLK